MNLFVYVDGVEGPLVVLQADRRGRHCLVVLGTDDDDDQVLFLRGQQNCHCLFNAQLVCEMLSQLCY